MKIQGELVHVQENKHYEHGIKWREKKYSFEKNFLMKTSLLIFFLIYKVIEILMEH